MIEPPNLPEATLQGCLGERYGLAVVSVEFLPVGHDTRAAVYRVTSGDSTYLLKVKRGELYTPTALVPHALHAQGIAAVVAPLPTRTNALWTQIAEWTLMLYPFITGESGWSVDLLPAQWRALGCALRRIHGAAVPVDGLAGMRRETFAPERYAEQMQALASHLLVAVAGNEIEQMFRSAWLAHQTTLHSALATMEHLGSRLRGQAGGFVICHADLHQGNIIREQDDRVAIIDWDDVMLAPKERDFLFTGEPAADAPFMQGYGETEIDWVALTYYRWERFIQDIIECSQCVFLRDDVTTVVKAEQARLFCDILVNGDEIAAARAAEAHIPN